MTARARESLPPTFALCPGARAAPWVDSARPSWLGDVSQGGPARAGRSVGALLAGAGQLTVDRGCAAAGWSADAAEQADRGVTNDSALDRRVRAMRTFSQPESVPRGFRGTPGDTESQPDLRPVVPDGHAELL